MSTQQQVFDVLGSERQYQEHKWDDGKHEIAGYILIMEHYLARARAACVRDSVTNYDVLNEIRKATAVGVACMEQHGAIPR
jgi:hypothetical protein